MTHKNYMGFKFSAFINKVLLKCSIVICLHSVYGCFHATIAKLNICDRDSILCLNQNQNEKYLLSGSEFTEQVCSPLPWVFSFLHKIYT